MKLYNLLQDSIIKSEPLIHPHLETPPRGSVEDRVAIYANGFYLRLEEVLGNDYPSLAWALGEDVFSELCRSYINTYPSTSYSLNFFGQHLQTYLKETEPYQKNAYLAEIAAYEWAESIAVIASDKVLLTAEDLQALPVAKWPETVFYLHPSSSLLSLDWNSLDIIEAFRSSNSIPKAKKLKVPQHTLIWRRQVDIRYCKLNPVEFTLINAIQSGANFLEICEHLSHKMPEDKVPTFLVQELYAWLEEQVFIKE
ncbi:MAG: putative DNA-binding domain-containing protein [Tatlockia sp.]|nr:putative DNA-binding domain-containing protein [Tatlockia sp.]